MPEVVNCSCGYRGPSIVEAGRGVCPICRMPAGLPAAIANATATPEAPAPRAAPPTYRIPCPRGHVLKAGGHLLGQQVVCPECNEMFLLREEDSVEHLRRREQARREEEERAAKRWLARSIWASAFIVVSLLGMIALSFAFRAPAPADPPTEPDPVVRTE